MEHHLLDNNLRIYVEDQVVPVLMSSALEAYEQVHRTPHGKGQTQLETYGLLWGYVVPAKTSEGEDKIIVTTATIETSAVRHGDWVEPNLDSIRAKKQMIEKYWPNLELVGTFHSHPYEDLSEVNDNKGWRASPADHGHWTYLHENIVEDQPLLAHLIFTVAAMSKQGWALPTDFSGKDHDGMSFPVGNRKLWFAGYATTCIEVDEGDDDYSYEYKTCAGKMKLDIPALSQRMLMNR